MSWAIFRSNYRKAIKNQEKDMASVIADSYGICTKAGTSIPGGPVLQGNVEGLKSQLRTELAITLPVCLLPIFNEGTLADGASRTPLEELPISNSECFKKL